LLVALFMVFPSLPAPDHGIAAIARKARDSSDALLLAAYVGALMSGALLLFGAALAARLRRAEGAAGGWWLVALVGIGATSIGIVGNALSLVFVRAVGHGAGRSELWVGYGADHWLGILSAAGGLPLRSEHGSARDSQPAALARLARGRRRRTPRRGPPRARGACSSPCGSPRGTVARRGA
jgi:hypothetical protein